MREDGCRTVGEGVGELVQGNPAILAAAVGPLPLAFSIDQLHSYTAALVAVIVLPLIAAVTIFRIGPPRLPARETV